MLPCGSTVAQQYPPLRQAPQGQAVRSTLQACYTAELGVREASGRNDGLRVGQYLAYCHLSQGNEWCAAFVSWCFGQAGRSLPRNPWAPALLPAARTICSLGSVYGPQPAPGDVFGIWHNGKKRIAHVGFVDRWERRYALTVEGNSNNQVERRRRPHRTLYKVADWVGRSSSQ